MALEANLISSGSILGVMDGKNWDKALNTHQSLLEVLERLLYKTFLHKELSMDCHDLHINLGGNLNESTITQVFQRLEINKQLTMYSEL